MAVIGHLIGTAFRAFFRILFAFVLAAALGAGVTLLVSYTQTHAWPPTRLTEIAAIAIAVLAGYACAITVLMGEGVRALLKTVKFAEKEALSTGNLVEHGVKAVEHLQGD